MEVVGDYQTQGYAHIRGLIPREVARAFMASIRADLVPEAIALNDADPHPRVLRRPAYEFHGHRYKPMSMFLWGLTPIVSQLVGKELLPGPDVRSRDALRASIRKYCNTIFHPVGTCRMGTDALSVVDPELRVRGVDGLRVIDASVMPTMTSANTNAAAVMIGEKGAALVLGAQQPRLAA